MMYSQHKRWLSLCLFIILSITLMLLSSTDAWELEQDVFVFENIIDCPGYLDESFPSSTVLQFIDNTFHKWNEYDIGYNGKFCIVMLKPEYRRLTADEAIKLLEESGKWEKQLMLGRKERETAAPVKGEKDSLQGPESQIQ